MDNRSENGQYKDAPSVLITGGSGTIGSRLTSVLVSAGFRVTHLSRREGRAGSVRKLVWDPSNGKLDSRVFDGIDYLVHLAGSGIGDKRWSDARKREIISSRVDSAELLLNTVRDNRIPLKAFISASATGYYGSVTRDRIFTEEDPPSGDFTGTTCMLWEKAAEGFIRSDIRTVMIRTPVVLARGAGALQKLMLPAKLGFVVRTGKGNQYFPWVHIDDLCGIYLKAITDNSMSGAYNAVAPEHIDHDRFIRTMAAVMKRPVFLPRVPEALLRVVMGEASALILTGSRISCEKIMKEGFVFRYKTAADALVDIINGRPNPSLK
jgi:uncharacterized protein (TIGR01777 family)